MRHTLVILVGAALAIAAAHPSIADDAAMMTVAGGSVEPMASHPSVRMLSETVTVRLSDKAARVRCEFTFKNEGPKQTVKMGFPEESVASGDSGRGMLYGFKSWVDGKPVECIYKKGKQPTDDRPAQRRYQAWFVKDVPFEAGQTRKVVDDYNSNLGYYANSMMSGDYEYVRYFNYVLRTGASWKGPIGRAVIVVDTSKVTEEHYDLVPRMPGFRRSKDRISWTFSNFEPRGDISIRLEPRYPILNGKKIAEGAWSPFNRVNGVTMVGLEWLRELGAEIEYPESRGPIVIRYGGKTLKLTPGSKTGYLDGKAVALQAAPRADVYPGQIPAASVVRALGGKAYYSTKDYRLHITLAKR